MRRSSLVAPALTLPSLAARDSLDSVALAFLVRALLEHLEGGGGQEEGAGGAGAGDEGHVFRAVLEEEQRAGGEAQVGGGSVEEEEEAEGLDADGAAVELAGIPGPCSSLSSTPGLSSRNERDRGGRGKRRGRKGGGVRVRVGCFSC